MKTETVEYQHGGTTFKGILFYDETRTGKRPGIVQAPDIRGVGRGPRGRVERIVGLGYSVLVADMYGDAQQMRDFPHGFELIKQCRSGDWRGRIRAAVDTLARRPEIDAGRIGAIGYCFGGSTVIELALSGADVKAVVSFHGGLDNLGVKDVDKVKSRILVCTGAEDPLVPAADVVAFQDALRKNKAIDWEVMTFANTKHSFTDPDLPDSDNTAYNQAADERSFAAMASLFREAFG